MQEPEYIIKHDGELVELETTANEWGLDELKSLMGYDSDILVQIIPLSEGQFMVMDEEGKLKDLPLNQKATLLSQSRTHLLPGDYIVGNVAVINQDRIS